MSLQSLIDRLIDACKTGDLLRVQELLNAAADLDASRSTSQIIHAYDDSAIRLAAICGNEAVCRLLIEHGADIHAANDHALRCAAERGYEAICRLLIEHGADVRAENDYALRWAVERGYEAVCRLLIEHGADIRAENGCALRWAAEYGHEAICRLLIKHGADIRARNDYAIRSAARRGHEAVCQLLLEGSDASDPDPLMARHIKPTYTKEVLRVFQAYGDHDAITEALMGRSTRRSPFTDDELAYIASCFISRKSAI